MSAIARPPTDTPADIGEACLALWSYWRGLARRDGVPDRRDFDPMALRPHLPMISLIEHEAPLLWRVRLIGSGIYQRSGRPMTGTNYLDLVHPAQRDAEDRQLAATLGRPCGLLSVRNVVRDTGLIYRSHILRLPLRDGEGRVRLLIGLNEEAARSNGEATDDAAPVTIVSARFIDIGAGVPAQNTS